MVGTGEGGECREEVPYDIKRLEQWVEWWTENIKRKFLFSLELYSSKDRVGKLVCGIEEIFRIGKKQ